MDYPELSCEEQKLQANLLTKKINELKEEAKTNNEKTEDFVRDLGKNGFFSFHIPNDKGVRKLNNLQQLRVFENYSFDTVLSLSVLIQQHIVIQAIDRWASDAIKMRFLSSLISGEKQAVSCVRERNSYILIPQVWKTKASLSSDGTSYIINGLKTELMNVDKSKLLFVLATIDDINQPKKAKSVAFIIESNSPGITFIPSRNSTFNLKNATTYDLVLNDVIVPITNLICDSSNGLEISKTLFTWENILISTIVWNKHKSLLERYNKFINDREVFGVPLLSFERAKLDVFLLCQNAFLVESTSYFLAGSIDRFPNQDFTIESAVTKVFGIESLVEWNDKYMLLLGHNGLCENSNDIENQKESECLLFHQIDCVNTRLLVARNCMEYIIKEHKSIEYDFYNRVLSDLGLGNSIGCTISDSNSLPYLSSYLFPDVLHFMHKFFNNFRKLLLTLNELQKKHGIELLNDDIFLMKLSTFILNVFVIIVGASRVTRAHCLNFPTANHQHYLWHKWCSNINYGFEADHKALITYCANRYKDVPVSDVWNRDKSSGIKIPHPYDI